MLKYLLVFFSCLIYGASCTPCTSQDIQTFMECMNETEPHEDQIKKFIEQCFVSNDCPIPTIAHTDNDTDTSHENSTSSEESGASREGCKEEKSKSKENRKGKGKGKGKGKSKEKGKSKAKGKGKKGCGHSNSPVNKTTLMQCKEEQKEQFITNVENCIKENITDFTFPEHIVERQKLGHRGPGQFRALYRRINHTSCPAHRNVTKCVNSIIKENFGHNRKRLCSAVNHCKNITNCSMEETHQIMCNCARSVSAETRNDSRIEFFECIGINPNSTEKSKSKEKGHKGKSKEKSHKDKGKGHKGKENWNHDEHHEMIELFCKKQNHHLCEEENHDKHTTKGNHGKTTRHR